MRFPDWEDLEYRKVMGTDVNTMASKGGPANSKLALAMKRIEAV